MAVTIGQVIALIKSLAGGGGGGVGGGVSDVKVNGTSVVTSGEADIPLAGSNVYGVVKKGDDLTIVNNITGSTPSIIGTANNRYICEECSTLSIVAPESGCIDVVFESGSTPTVLTVTSAKSGVSAIKWPAWFDEDNLDANVTYEINILDGEFGVVTSWT